MAIVHAPFTKEQIEHLEEWQFGGAVHPFTCPNRDNASHLKWAVLLPSKQGLGFICEYCDYVQDWAHDFMLNGEALNRHGEIMKKLAAAKKLI